MGKRAGIDIAELCDNTANDLIGAIRINCAKSFKDLQEARPKDVEVMRIPNGLNADIVAVNVDDVLQVQLQGVALQEQDRIDQDIYLSPVIKGAAYKGIS